MRIDSKHYTQGNGPWRQWPTHIPNRARKRLYGLSSELLGFDSDDNKVEWSDAPKGVSSCDSDRIGWHYIYLDTEQAIPLIEEWSGQTGIKIVEVWTWKDASSGHPGFTIFYQAESKK
jgi:hypothetical protein